MGVWVGWGDEDGTDTVDEAVEGAGQDDRPTLDGGGVSGPVNVMTAIDATAGGRRRRIRVRPAVRAD
ncbi:hypothetical protein P3T34_005101 [Kitasatospora sp. MAP12-44]|uniref:hypothetical protein n=1 Tax=Kitasatospora sp. MAP12-44 TaxID=3035099 RepID=UPI002472F67C|nr:hypothetical protein [Kitasatospora sp. MAP12-44]MDH6112886.1 hypothetical protein [Kitasatospora sp. MAP12-44]